MIEKLQKLVEQSDDESAEYLIDCTDIEYEVVEEGDWIDDGKYQHRNFDVKIDGKYYSFSESRSGSYYTDWYHSVPEVCEYTPDTRYHVTYTFPSKEVAKEFVSFISENEQGMWEWDELANVNPGCNFKTGTIEFKYFEE